MVSYLFADYIRVWSAVLHGIFMRECDIKDRSWNRSYVLKIYQGDCHILAACHDTPLLTCFFFCAELSFLPYPLLQAGVPGLL